MRIALIDTTPKAKQYPLPMLKIGAWRKSLGDTCELFDNRLPVAGEFDAIWLTTCFTFDIPHSLGVAASLLPEQFERRGLRVHRGLIPEAEAMAPDYSLLPEEPDYSITHTSRGCPRRCEFCMVHRLEPKFSRRETWTSDLHPQANRILFYDNNWFAKGKRRLLEDVRQIRELVDSGRITSVDFNQGLDCRLLTEEIADALVGVPINPVRFAFDGMQEDGHYQRAVEMMAKRGFDEFMTYVLYNFEDSPEDLWYRLRESVRLTEELGVVVKSFPMRYSPILKVKRSFVGKRWTFKMLTGFIVIRASHSVSGQVSCLGGYGWSAFEEFEYWFGETAEKFRRLLQYDKLRLLLKRKVGHLREVRRERRKAEQAKVS